MGLAVLQLVADEPLISGSGILGALAAPPALMSKFLPTEAKRIRIYHYEPDKLCSWSPEDQEVTRSPFHVRNSDNNMDRRCL